MAKHLAHRKFVEQFRQFDSLRNSEFSSDRERDRVPNIFASNYQVFGILRNVIDPQWADITIYNNMPNFVRTSCEGGEKHSFHFFVCIRIYFVFRLHHNSS